MTGDPISPESSPTQPRDARLIENILRDDFIETEVVKGFVGRRFRANRLIQRNDGHLVSSSAVDNTLVYHMSGGIVERFDGRRINGKSDRFRTSTLIPAYQKNTWLMPDSLDVLQLYIDDDDLKHFAASEYGFDTNQLEMRDYMGVEDKFMQHLGPLVLQELRSDLPQSHLMLDWFDAVVAGHMLRAYSNMSDTVFEIEDRERNHRDKNAVRAARDMLTDHLADNLTAKEIGKALNIEPFRQMRLFKREVGMTMHQFVMRKRVEYVHFSLKHTNTPLVDIAYDIGFSSQAHMNTVYAKFMGISPGRHRRELRG